VKAGEGGGGVAVEVMLGTVIEVPLDVGVRSTSAIAEPGKMGED